LIHHETCPVCKGSNIGHHLFAKDHTVSGKEFPVWKCGDCSLRFTQDIPDEGEIGPYYNADSYVSHTETKQGLINKLYHIIRKRTLQKKYELIVETTGKPAGEIIDIGCGTGAFLEVMKNKGWGVCGLEPDPAARQKAKERGLRVWEPSELRDLASQHFDAVTLWHVLEHVHSLDDYMQHISRIVRSSGRILIAVPNHASTDANHYGKNWAAWDVPRHLYHFSPKSMQILLERHNLTLVSKRPMWFDSFYVSMLSEQYKNGKGNLLSAVLHGGLSNLKAIFDTGRCSSIIYEIKK